MRTKFYIIAIIFIGLAPLKALAINYTINFTGSGASATVDSVVVQNLTKGTTVMVPAGNALNLSDATTVIEQINAIDESIHVYPETVTGKYRVSFFAKEAGVTQMNAYCIDGRKVVGIICNLQEGLNIFQLDLPKGVFIVKVNGTGFSHSCKLISHSGLETKPEISFKGNEKTTSTIKQKSKNVGGVTTMIYTDGDQLLYKGKSGCNSTIVTDIPTGDKTTNFEFVECKDADGNYYSVVKIGTQIWMAENLKAIKYRNNDLIPNVQDNNDWYTLSTPAYCTFNNDDVNVTKFGRLYNWYVVIDNRNISPNGWHIPSQTEWLTFENYLIVNGFGYGTDAIAKSLATTTEWNSYITEWVSYDEYGYVGNHPLLNNKTGFSAFPSGYRFVGYSYSNGTGYSSMFGGASGYYNGQWNYGNYCCWWTTTESGSNPYEAMDRFLTTNFKTLCLLHDAKKFGFSIRCLKD